MTCLPPRNDSTKCAGFPERGIPKQTPDKNTSPKTLVFRPELLVYFVLNWSAGKQVVHPVSGGAGEFEVTS